MAKQGGRPFRLALIVLGIFAVMTIIYLAAPIGSNFTTYPPKPPYTPANTCPEVLLQLDDAITVWSNEHNKTPLDRPTLQMLDTYFSDGHTPICPQGGTIILGTKSLATICSVHGMAVDNRPPPGEKQLGYLVRKFPILGAKFKSAKNPCIADLKQMEGAQQQWALQNNKKDGDHVDINGVIAYLYKGQLLTCPEGGKYQFSYVSNAPTCTRALVSGHSLP